LIVEILEVLFLGLAGLMMAYLVRHYIFTLAVLRWAQKGRKAEATGNASYQPTVSILIPAYNEERVIGRILQRMTELTYPKD
jgi:cellulose synthase/poly-beta-1,6-N-acetylglucosamine synthase-like glycosyltransferase